MDPSPESHKSSATPGAGQITSSFRSPLRLRRSSPMSFFSKGLFGSTNSGSSSRPSRSPSRSPVSPPSHLGPGSSKRDYTFGLNPSTPTTSRGHAQSFYDASGDKPPPYDDPNFGSSSADMPEPHKASSATHIHTDSDGEAPLKILESYDVVIILDDSNSMTAVDRKTGRTRWNEVGNFSLIILCMLFQQVD